MKYPFQILALDRSEFDEWYHLNPSELAARGGECRMVDAQPGYPCRISLEDAPVGEKVLLLPYQHHAVDSPYQASGPIFIRCQTETARLEVNEIPNMLRHRLLSLRAYDKNAMMIDAETIAGEKLAQAIDRIFDREEVSYIHVHNAGPGCYNCSIQRA